MAGEGEGAEGATGGLETGALGVGVEVGVADGAADEAAGCSTGLFPGAGALTPLPGRGEVDGLSPPAGFSVSAGLSPCPLPLPVLGAVWVPG